MGEWSSFADLAELIRLGGLVVVAGIVFVETGLLFGFFLPGDSLLLTAGVFAARGDLDLASLVVWTSLAACLGDATGYGIGRRAGAALYARPETRLFKRRHLLAARDFYQRHGGRTLVVSRFVPFLRTFAPLVAGIAAMPFRRFAAWSAAGGVAWVGSMTTTGYLLGRAVPDIESYVAWLVTGVVLVMLLPAAGVVWRQRRRVGFASQASARATSQES